MTDPRFELSPAVELDGAVVLVAEVPGIIIAGDPFPILKEHA